MPAITRRSVLGAIAAISTTAAGTGSASAHVPVGNMNADAELLALEAEVYRICDLFDAASDKREELYQQVESKSGPKPEGAPFPPDVKADFLDFLDQAGKAKSREELDHLLANPLHLRMREHEAQNARIAADWEARRDEIRRQCGWPHVEAEAERLMNATGDIAESMLDIRALTPAGMMAKLRVHERWDFNQWEILNSITADIEQMAAAEPQGACFSGSHV
ncbi:hypothetical protein [Mesorhizobium sp. WSM2239]|uniref:Uncharacterized protein n=2 Tax=unclassified Mesorhizobium TaxID=325217 RepID=A0AAU8D147_9HYPH